MTTMRENLRGRIEELKTLRDQIRVDLNLAGRDLRDEWRELEKRLPDPKHLAREIKTVSAETLDEILEEARRFRRRLGAGVNGETVGSLMSRNVAACTPETSLAEAAREMWQHDVGSLPVLDPDGRVVAMVTDRDACMAAYLAGTALDRIPVRTAMSRTVYTCGPDASPAEAEQIMSDRQIRRLPVVDAEGKLVGIVTLADLARKAVSARGTNGVPAEADVTSTLAAVVAPRTDGPSAALS